MNRLEITQELINNFKADYGFDAEEELTKILKDEIDREILNNLMSMGDVGKPLGDQIEFYDSQYMINKDSIAFSSYALNALRQSIELRVKLITKKHCS